MCQHKKQSAHRHGVIYKLPYVSSSDYPCHMSMSIIAFIDLVHLMFHTCSRTCFRTYIDFLYWIHSLISNANPNNPEHNITKTVERHHNVSNLHLETARNMTGWDNLLLIA
jgi:hypothetical protein